MSHPCFTPILPPASLYTTYPAAGIGLGLPLWPWKKSVAVSHWSCWHVPASRHRYLFVHQKDHCNAWDGSPTDPWPLTSRTGTKNVEIRFPCPHKWRKWFYYTYVCFRSRLSWFLPPQFPDLPRGPWSTKVLGTQNQGRMRTSGTIRCSYLLSLRRGISNWNQQEPPLVWAREQPRADQCPLPPALQISTNMSFLDDQRPEIVTSSLRSSAVLPFFLSHSSPAASLHFLALVLFWAWKLLYIPAPPASTATFLAWVWYIRSPTTTPTVQNWTDQNHQADPFMQGCDAPVEKWFLSILTESCEYSNSADRAIKETHSGPCCVSVPSIEEMALTKTVKYQLSWQNHQSDPFGALLR